MIIHSSNFPIRQIPVCKQPFSENHNPLSTNPAVIQVKVSEKKTLSIFLLQNGFTLKQADGKKLILW